MSSLSSLPIGQQVGAAGTAAEGKAQHNAVAIQLPKQHFTGNPLNRAYDVRRRFDGTSQQEEVSLVVVAGREVCVRNAGSAHNSATQVPLNASNGRNGLFPNASNGKVVGGGAMAAATAAAAAATATVACAAGSGVGLQQDLQALLLPATDPELDLDSDSICLNWRDGDVPYELPLYLLGQDRSERWTFALDVSAVKTAFMAFLRDACGLEVAMQDLRVTMPSLSCDACAIAGQAVALSQWHQTHQFCPRCGSATVPVETGLRRACIGDPAHKQYPRTDPVVIMLVESPDGRRALLGRNKKFTPGMYTCLSGFIDQCESIEEAVRREVREEARVMVDDVQVIGSQPWPIGRAGSCELMLGCMAKARSYEIFVNPAEMEDVQWYEREELAAAVQLYEECDEDASVAELQEASMEALGFFIPPPLAVAHHLIRAWALHEGPWFTRPGPGTSRQASMPLVAPEGGKADVDAATAAAMPTGKL